MSLVARPMGSPDASWAPATGTGVAGFPYRGFSWDTQMPGFAPLGAP